jgi:hypothetical protein
VDDGDEIKERGEEVETLASQKHRRRSRNPGDRPGWERGKFRSILQRPLHERRHTERTGHHTTLASATCLEVVIRCWVDKKVPADWTKFCMIALEKKGNLSLPSNCRGMSISETSQKCALPH